MTAPALASTHAELASLLADARAGGRAVGFVPTMGALHEGHASLIRTAAERGPVVVSIFVNPLQFGAGEDLDRYPRTLEADLEMCAREGADIVFAPSVEEVYPGGEPQVTVEPGPLADLLEGKLRPDHYRGVLTVVAKLFGLVRPDVAVFGEKDYQQLVLVRRMVLDLNMGVEVVGAPTVREEDGLALSSRNRYLGEAERRAALVLAESLRAADAAAAQGPSELLAEGVAAFGDHDGVSLDYFVVVDPDTFLPVAEDYRGRALVLVAALVGSTRLIDNAFVEVGSAA
jgi:pantoate--beta-alanine ligase